MSNACLASHWFFSPPFGGIRTIGVTPGASEPEVAICRRLSMYCRPSRSARGSQKLCSISNTTPSYFETLSANAASISAGENVVKAGSPASSARITPLRCGISATLVLPTTSHATKSRGHLRAPPAFDNHGNRFIPSRRCPRATRCIPFSAHPFTERTTPAPSERLTITDDQIRESLEGAQLKIQRARATDLTIFRRASSPPSHSAGDRNAPAG